ncbi:MAG: ModD protein [Anaerovoracaceae bacterium]
MYTAQLDFDALIKEDTPYFDLTAHVLGLEDQMLKISYFTREECRVCGTEEVAEVFSRLRIRTEEMLPSGSSAAPGSVLISGVGRASDIHMAWKVGQNLLDHASGMATKAARFVQIVHSVNRNVAVLTTRKIFPGTKSLSIKSILAGGAEAHRLGTSESILVFPQQIRLMGGMDVFLKKIPQIRSECCEKKIIVETDDVETAKLVLAAGADGIQFEKLTPQQLTAAVRDVKEEFPSAVLLAAGGINESNAAAYAASGVHGLVTTSLYSAKPVDIGARLEAAEA